MVDRRRRPRTPKVVFDWLGEDCGDIPPVALLLEDFHLERCQPVYNEQETGGPGPADPSVGRR